MADRPTGRLAQVTGADVSIDPAEHYDGWADSYDRDLLNQYGYCAHTIATDALKDELADKNAAIIDVGCDTGLVGVELTRHGYTTVDGVDVSPKMLAKAEETGVYRRLITQDAQKANSVPNSAYDAVVCVGSFGIGHLGPSALPGLVAMSKPGGLIVIFMNAEPFHLEDYDSHLNALSECRAWTGLRVEDHNYMDAIDRPGKLILAHRG